MNDVRARTGIAGMIGAGVLAALLSSSNARAATLRVPQEYSTISAAANVALPRDSILVSCESDYCEYENEEITLRQGVVLRGMEQIYPVTQMRIVNSSINLMEEAPTPHDTTRVENLSIFNAPFQEAIQVNTPRSSIVDCRLRSSGPQDWTTVRVWKGGLIARNYFGGVGESNAMEVRQGEVIVAQNVFDRVFRALGVFNQGASAPASVLFQNNTVFSSQTESVLLFLRSDSDAEIVNTIFHDSGGILCSGGTVQIHYSDLYLTSTQCPLGPGNISAYAEFCTETTYWLEPGSPCIGAGEGGATMGAGGICGVTSIDVQEYPSNPLRLSVDPNPITSSAEFSFDGLESPVLEIFDPQGRLIDRFHPRAQRVRWSPSPSRSAGVYFARLRGTGFSETVKFLVIR